MEPITRRTWVKLNNDSRKWRKTNEVPVLMQQWGLYIPRRYSWSSKAGNVRATYALPPLHCCWEHSGGGLPHKGASTSCDSWRVTRAPLSARLINIQLERGISFTAALLLDGRPSLNEHMCQLSTNKPSQSQGSGGIYKATTTPSGPLLNKRKTYKGFLAPFG